MPEAFSTPYADFTIHDASVVEVIAVPGVNITIEHWTDAVERVRQRIGDRPFALLSNRAHDYSYSYEFLRAVANTPGLVAWAFLVRAADHDRVSSRITRLFVEEQIPFDVFPSSEAAHAWLLEIVQREKEPDHC